MPSCQWCPCGDGEKYHILPLPLTTWSPISHLFASLYAVEVALCLCHCQAGVLLSLSLSLSLMWEGWEYFIANLTTDGLQCFRVSGAIVVTGEKYHILPLPLTTWSPISLSLCFIACCRGSPPLPSRGALSLSLSCGFHNYGFEYMDSYPFKCW